MTIDQDKTRRVRVIIADDNKEMRDTVTRYLESDFDIVGAVADGRALVDAVDKLEPDIGIIDISMPLMNGIEAAAAIKDHGSSMNFIFLTVSEDNDFVRAAFETGATGYVIKRRMASDLSIALKKVLGGLTFVSPGCQLDGN